MVERLRESKQPVPHHAEDDVGGEPVREIGKYLQLTGVDGFIVPSAWIASPARGLPHMFTDDELARRPA